MPRLPIPFCFFLIFLSLVLAIVTPRFAHNQNINPIVITHEVNFQFEPATITLTLRIAPHEDNREVCVETNGTNGYSRISCFPHIGLTPSSQVRIQYRDLRGARYHVQAVLSRFHDGQADNDFYFANATFCVLARGEPNTCD